MACSVESSLFSIWFCFHCVGSDESQFVDLIVEEVKKVLIKIFTDNEKAMNSIIGANKTFKEERTPSFWVGEDKKG